MDRREENEWLQEEAENTKLESVSHQLPHFFNTSTALHPTK